MMQEPTGRSSQSQQQEWDLWIAVAFKQGVIAEGVETAKQGIPLMQMGCDFAQGYFIHGSCLRRIWLHGLATGKWMPLVLI
jgi:EAL domain-containing protein (putative c-di-GMP-specific phosphodiesterase class I)